VAHPLADRCGGRHGAELRGHEVPEPVQRVAMPEDLDQRPAAPAAGRAPPRCTAPSRSAPPARAPRRSPRAPPAQLASRQRFAWLAQAPALAQRQVEAIQRRRIDLRKPQLAQARLDTAGRQSWAGRTDQHCSEGPAVKAGGSCAEGGTLAETLAEQSRLSGRHVDSAGRSQVGPVLRQVGGRCSGCGSLSMSRMPVARSVDAPYGSPTCNGASGGLRWGHRQRRYWCSQGGDG